MIITRKYAKMLVRERLATELCTIVRDGVEYVAVDRHDIRRTDLYVPEQKDLDTLYSGPHMRSHR